MIKKVEVEGSYSIIVENNSDKEETILGIDGYSIMFTCKQDVVDHIAVLNKALEFWEYE